MKKFLIIFFLIFGSGLGIAYGFNAGWYPAAFISPAAGDTKIIWAKEVNQVNRASIIYYQRLGAKIDAPTKAQIRLAALDKIIEKALISNQLNALASPELTALVEQILTKYQDKPELGPAAAELYGLSLEEFYKLVLVPQAEREWWEKKLGEEGQTLEEWLAQQKQTTKIVRFLKYLRA